jgi:hypothetical protein
VKIYLAAKWANKEYMKTVAEQLKACGHEITSRWIHFHKGVGRQESALQDVEDVLKADMLVSFTESPTAGYMTGGRHVEFGIAYASGKQLILVGPKENIFHDLPNVIQLNSVIELIDYLKGRS